MQAEAKRTRKKALCARDNHLRREEADDKIEDVDAERVGDNVPPLRKVAAGVL